jgi:hypothetical protein
MNQNKEWYNLELKSSNRKFNLTFIIYPLLPFVFIIMLIEFEEFEA